MDSFCFCFLDSNINIIDCSKKKVSMRHISFYREFYKEMALKNLLHVNWMLQADG